MISSVRSTDCLLSENNLGYRLQLQVFFLLTRVPDENLLILKKKRGKSS